MVKTAHDQDPKTLVSVFDSMESAKEAVAALTQAGFGPDMIEVVSHDVATESPDVETPPVHEITASVMVDSAEKWGAIGAGAGAAAGITLAAVTGFPGIALGAIFAGGLTGVFFGGIAGVDKAVHDDSVNLPTLQEYQQMVEDGMKLVVVRGTHAEVMRARDVLATHPSVRSHVFPLHGHEFHEHPR